MWWVRGGHPSTRSPTPPRLRAAPRPRRAQPSRRNAPTPRGSCATARAAPRARQPTCPSVPSMMRCASRPRRRRRPPAHPTQGTCRAPHRHPPKSTTSGKRQEGRVSSWRSLGASALASWRRAASSPVSGGSAPPKWRRSPRQRVLRIEATQRGRRTRNELSHRPARTVTTRNANMRSENRPPCHRAAS